MRRCEQHDNLFTGAWRYDPSMAGHSSYSRHAVGCKIDIRQDCRAQLAAMRAQSFESTPSASFESFHHERWWWQPEECSLAPVQPEGFARYTLSHPITFIGDSLTRGMYESLTCLLGQHKHRVNLVVSQFLVDAVTHPKLNSTATSADVYVHRLHKLMGHLSRNGVCHRSHTLVLATGHWYSHAGNTFIEEPARQGGSLPSDTPSRLRVVRQSGSHTARLHPTYAPRKHGTEARYMWGVPGSLRDTVAWSRPQVLDSIVQGLTKVGCNATIIYRTFSPWHFKDGTWDSGGRCEHGGNVTRVEEALRPWLEEQTHPTSPVDAYRTNDESSFLSSDGTPMTRSANLLLSNSKASAFAGWGGLSHALAMRAAAMGAAVKARQTLNWRLLDITWLSLPRSDAHPGGWRSGLASSFAESAVQDCSHWCLPGVPDVWNALLAAMLGADAHTSY